MFRALMAALTLSALCACARSEPLVVVAERCYQSSDGGATWSVNSDAQDMDTCFELSNHGGQANTLFKWATAADAPAIDWASRPSAPANTDYVDASPYAMDPASADYAAEDASGPACYLRGDETGRGWVQVGGREAQCFAQDSCSGGLGERPGLCFKWALSADAPALPWSATLTNPRPVGDIPPPAGVRESSGEVSAECLDGGCEPHPTRVPVDTVIYARQDTTAPVVGTIQASECVQPGGERILSAPQRGVVLETTETFTAGEVIYLLRYDGDYVIWWRGEEHSGAYSPNSVVVRWDEIEVADPREGRWIQYTRANGQSGWARNPHTSEQGCTFVRR
jgi:hypothetical protein